MKDNSQIFIKKRLRELIVQFNDFQLQNGYIEELINISTTIIENLIIESKTFATRNNRKTIKIEDLQLAKAMILEEKYLR